VRRVDANDRIYKTQREKYNAVIDEIAACHARKQPVLVGTVSVEHSEIISRMLKRRNIPHNVLNAKNHEREAEIVSRAGQPGSVTIATNMAGRGTDIKLGEGVVWVPRETILSGLRLDDRMEGGRTLLERLQEEPCGLHVVGSERHESRRIDRQLRGRCARQGDPGSSSFYVSLEDDLMRLFGSDRISGIMEKLGIQEGEVLEHPWLNRSIETAQRRVEQHNFSIRKRTLEYDDVMNKQREIIYGFRGEVLRAEGPGEHLLEMVSDVISQRAEPAAAGGPAARADFVQWADTMFPIGLQNETLPADMTAEGLAEAVLERVRQAYQLKTLSEDRAALSEMERHLVLHAIDTHWQEYLRGMDALRQGVGLRAYGQRDPLVEYKHEAYDLFSDLMDRIKSDVAGRMFRSATSLSAYRSFLKSLPRTLVHANPQTLGAVPASSEPDPVSGEEAALQAALKAPAQPVRRDMPKVGRNDPCPCGSGKKYKKCCGAGEG
jgi:preprotein translocase subunit SecA